MAVYDASNAECHVYTYKEGVLSAIAHDLKIRVSTFRIDVSEGEGDIQGEFDAASLSVVCAMNGTRELHGSLSDSDKRKIERNIRKDVLNVRRFPLIRFRANDVRDAVTGPIVSGELELHGRRRSVEAFGIEQDGRLVFSVTLNQPDFGIQPYRAMMGTLRIQPRVKVHLSVPKP